MSMVQNRMKSERRISITAGVTSSPVILVSVSASKFLAMMSALSRIRSRTKLATEALTPCHPSGAHRAFHALRGRRFVRVGRAADDVGDADDFVDRVLLLIAGHVEFFQRVDPFQNRHQPNVILQVLPT